MWDELLRLFPRGSPSCVPQQANGGGVNQNGTGEQDGNHYSIHRDHQNNAENQH